LNEITSFYSGTKYLISKFFKFQAIQKGNKIFRIGDFVEDGAGKLMMITQFFNRGDDTFVKGQCLKKDIEGNFVLTNDTRDLAIFRAFPVELWPSQISNLKKNHSAYAPLVLLAFVLNSKISLKKKFFFFLS